MRIYLSGPINDRPNFVREFKANENLLIAAGYEVTNPVDLRACSEFDCWSRIYGQRTRYPAMQGEGLHTWECYMRFDIIALVECDAIAMMPGWMKSSGCNLEYTIATQLNFPTGTVAEWVNRSVANLARIKEKV